MNLTSTKISLYIHIPFCSSKCKYCDFYSETSGFERVHNVVTEIIEQLKFNYEKLKYPEIETVFIGGGTPSFLPAEELKRLLQVVSKIAPSPKEWTIESNPESISKDFLLTCKNNGVNRLSVGIQSFENSLLNIMGREAKKSNIESAMELITTYWDSDFSIDLISSLPEQTTEMVRDDIKNALKYNPDHISFYALSLEEGTVLEDEVSKNIIKELDVNVSDDIWLTGREILREAGYNDYEVSNYSKKKPCLHNLNYWELKPYLGIGPGAVSTLIDENGQISRITNKKSIKGFLEGKKNSWGEDTVLLSSEDFLEDYIMMGLRLQKGIDKKRFENIFNRTIESCIGISHKLEQDGLINISEERYTLSSDGYDIMNSVLVQILKSLEGIKLDTINWYY